jgi:hypothetical protein
MNPRPAALKPAAAEGKKEGHSGQRSLQPSEKAQFGEENPRKSGLFPLLPLAVPWLGLAGFG